MRHARQAERRMQKLQQRKDKVVKLAKVIYCLVFVVWLAVDGSDSDGSQQPTDTGENRRSSEGTKQEPANVAQKDIKASSVQIAYMSGTKVIGEIGFKLGPDLMPGQGEASGPVKVTIFREIAPQHLETARKWGVKVGGAYLEKGPGQYEYVRDVDLRLSDEELAKQFGVETQ